MVEEENIELIQKRISSWSEFDELINLYNYREWVYRGQANANWNLESSLVRLFKSKKSKLCYSEGVKRSSYEKVMINRFKSIAHLYINNLPELTSDFEWLSLMQHYGVYTRMIDVSFSPYIACFFALSQGQEDCAIYAIEHKYFNKVANPNFESINDLNEEFTIFTYEPKYLNDRLKAQQGLFLVTAQLNKSVEDYISPLYCLEDSFYKIIIPKELREEGINKLKKMNINYSTLFGGLDGACRAINDIIY